MIGIDLGASHIIISSVKYISQSNQFVGENIRKL